MEEFFGEFLYIILTLIVLIGSAIVKMFEKKNQPADESSNGVLSLFDEQDEQEEKEMAFYDEEEKKEYSEKQEIEQNVPPVVTEMKEQQDTRAGNEQDKQQDKKPKQLYDWRQGIVMSEILQRKHFTI